MPSVPEPPDPPVPLHDVVSAAALRAMRSDASACGPDDPAAWLRLRRNHYMSQETWDGLSPTERLQVMVHVVSASAERRKVASHCSAAGVWSIPLIGPVPEQAEIVVPDRSAGRSPGVIRHRSQNCPKGVLHDGVWVTPPARTAVDLARVRSLASGVAALDHVLHHRMASRAELIREQEAIPRGGRGRQRARLAVALADEKSESAGESLSRVRLFELGYPRPTLQHEFHDERGVFVGRPDMYWRQHKIIGEFDGRVKYPTRLTRNARETRVVPHVKLPA